MSSITLSWMAQLVLSSAPLQSIPQPHADLTGGTTNIATVAAVAIPSGGLSTQGTLKNAIRPGETITRVVVTIANGTASSVTVNGQSVQAAGRVFDIPFPSGTEWRHLAYCQWQATGLEVSPAGSTKPVVIDLTPIAPREPLPAVSLDVLPGYELRRSTDQMRSGVGLFARGALAVVTNGDVEHRIDALHGEVSFPGTASAELVDVYLLGAGDVPLSTTVSIDGDEFTVSGIPPMAHGETVQVVLLFDSSLEGQPMRCRIAAGFVP
jgi:hypothetical protein